MKYIPFILFFVFPLIGNVSNECGNEIQPGSEDDLRYHHSVEKWRKSDFSQDTREYYWAPVTWHVVRETNGQGGVPLERLNQGILDLNIAYDPRGIRFYQMGDVDTIDNSDYYFDIDSYDEITDLRLVNPVEGTINIYLVANLSTGDNTLCGISTFSWYESQGIVMANDCFSTWDNHSTLAHEVGHYFDLVHTHSGSPQPDENGVIAGPSCEFADFSECAVRGDDFCDTSADPKLDEIVDSNCNYYETYVDGHGDLFDPPTLNYMSYSQKFCRDVFSEEQLDKALYTVIYIRTELFQPAPTPYISMLNYAWAESQGDGDLLLNQGESAMLNFSFLNWSGFPDGQNFSLSLISENPDISVVTEDVFYPVISSGDTLTNSGQFPEIQLNESIPMGTHEVVLMISAEGPDGVFWDEIPLEVQVTMNQVGFPVLTEYQINGSPAVIDLDDDGSLEILFADYSGFLYCLDQSGDLVWSFNTGDQVWSAPAAADIDLDGELEIVITSLSRNLTILNFQGMVEAVYETDQFLVGTPAIGNIDDDPEKEIIFGGYQSAGKLFAVNHDGLPVDGFPVVIGEKFKSSVGLSDLDNDGLDEIIFGTEGGHLWLADQGGIAWQGFPVPVENAIKSSPVIVKFQDSSLLVTGSTDGSIYGFSLAGNLLFQIQTGGVVYSDISVLDFENTTKLFCGSDDGHIYAFDPLGVSSAGWPLDLGSAVLSPPVFADFNNDLVPEIIVGNSAGELHVLTLDGTSFPGFPIPLNGTATSSSTLTDLDTDGDVEILTGTSIQLTAVDVKLPSNPSSYWSTGRNGIMRRGEFISNLYNPAYSNGDVNLDGLVNISDIIVIVAFIIGTIELDLQEQAAGDLNYDGQLNISDVILIVDIILNP